MSIVWFIVGALVSLIAGAILGANWAAHRAVQVLGFHFMVSGYNDEAIEREQEKFIESWREHKRYMPGDRDRK